MMEINVLIPILILCNFDRNVSDEDLRLISTKVHNITGVTFNANDKCLYWLPVDSP